MGDNGVEKEEMIKRLTMVSKCLDKAMEGAPKEDSKRLKSSLTKMVEKLCDLPGFGSNIDEKIACEFSKEFGVNLDTTEPESNGGDRTSSSDDEDDSRSA